MSQPLPIRPAPSTPVATSQPQPQYVVDPYGSGATFSWQGGRIPQAGDPDFIAYNQALGNWLQQRQEAYQQSPQYQTDQAANNPDIASGRIPSIGFVAEGPNVWGVPVGATVTALEQQEGGSYSIEYKEKGTPQEVTVSGPGYSVTGTVYAKDAGAAAAIAMAGTRVQVAGVDVSPNKLGGYVASSNEGHAVVQVGNVEQNKYWESMGLPQYAGYSIPKLTAEQEAEGFYIKDVKAAGTAPAVTLANRQWEQFWSAQGYPEYSNYKPPTFAEGDYFKSITQTDEGLKFTVSNRQAEAEAAAKQASNEQRLAEINRQLGVINTQNRTFSDALSTGKIKPSEYQSAMSVQNQNTINLLNEAEGLGFITSGEKQAQVNQMSSFMVDVDSYVKAYDKYTGITGKISRENEVFAASLQSGKITQQEYNVAIGVQNQLQIRAIKEASIEGVINPTVAESSVAEININYQQFLNSQKVNAPFSTPTVSSGLANAARMSEIKTQASNLSARQGTRTTGITEAQILSTLTPEEQKVYTDQKTQQAIFKGVSAGAFVLAGATVPFSLPTSITLSGIKVLATEVVLGAGISVGVNEAVNYRVTKQWLTPQQVAVSAGEGALFAVLGRGSLNALSRVAPTVSASIIGQAGVNTVLGASVGYFTSGGDPTQTAIGGASGLVLTFAVAGLGRIAPRIIGRQATEVKGATEYYEQIRIGNRVETVRVTEYNVGSTRLRGGEVDLYSRYNLRTIENPTLEMAGVQRVKTISPYYDNIPQEVTYFKQPLESTRAAQPMINAIDDQPIKWGKVGAGTQGIEKVELQTGKANIGPYDETLIKLGLIKPKPATYLSKEIVYSKDILLDTPDVIFSAREYSAIKVTGQIDEAGAANAIKALPIELADDMYKKLGGGYRPIVDYGSQQPRDLSGAMPKGSNAFFRGNKKVTPPESKANTPDVLTETEIAPVGKAEIVLDRAILDVAAPTEIKTVTPIIAAASIENISQEPLAQDSQTTPFTMPSTFPGLRRRRVNDYETEVIPAYQGPLDTQMDSTTTNIMPINETNMGQSFREVPTVAPINISGVTLNQDIKIKNDLTVFPDVSSSVNTLRDTVTAQALKEVQQEQIDTILRQELETKMQETLSMPPIRASIITTDTINQRPEESEDDRKKKKKKSDLDEIIETFTAFRTKSRIKIEPLSDEIVKRQPGVEKQVVTAKLVGFYPTSSKKLPKDFKSKKGDNQYFRVVTIGGVRGVGQFKGTGRALNFYPTNKKNKSVLDEGNEWIS